MNNKRRHEEIVFDESPSNKRTRLYFHEETLEDKLDELLVKIGESIGIPVEQSIEELANLFKIELLRSDTKIIEVICECITEFPQKVCVYSTLIGILNTKNYNFVAQIVDHLISDFQKFLQNNSYDHARVILRMFADLVNTNVISISSLINLFESLLETITEDNIPQCRSDYYVFVVLSALPWVGHILAERNENELEVILNRMDEYIKNRKTIYQEQALRVWHIDDPLPQEDYLKSLWQQISNLRTNRWNDNHILRPYSLRSEVFSDACSHNIPPIRPPPHEEENQYPFPKVVFRLFDSNYITDKRTLPPAHSIERFIVEDNLRCVLNQTCYDRRLCAESLLGYGILSTCPNLALEHVILEVVYSEMFALPVRKEPEICYGSLLIEIYRQSPKTFPIILATSIEILYDRLDTMNATCIQRFASWFAYNLSQFEFLWRWDDWSSALKQGSLEPKPVFLKEALLKCLRLISHDRLLAKLPKDFEVFYPKKPQAVNKFMTNGGALNDSLDDDDPTTRSMKSLTMALQMRSPNQEIIDLLDRVGQEDFVDPETMKIDLFMTAFLNVSSRTMSHCFSFILRYQDVLKTLNATEENQITILNSTIDALSNHQQLMVLVVDKLLKNNIIQEKSIVSWIFFKHSSEEFTRFYLWEILHLAVKFSMKKVKKIKTELADVKEKIKKLEEESPEMRDELLQNDLEKLEESLEKAEQNQIELFQLVFQRFFFVLTNHIQTLQNKGEYYRNYWFFWILSRLQEVFFEYNDVIHTNIGSFESLFNSKDLDSNISTIIQQFYSYRN